MATSINGYSVKLSMDAAGFVDATKVSRSEARQLIREIEGAQSPMEKFAVQQDRWKKQLEDGAISQGVYNRLIRANAPAAMSVTSAMGPLTVALGASVAAFAAVGTASVAFVNHMRNVQNAVDESADAATRLGVSFTDLKSLQFGFQEGAGIDAKTVEDSIKKMQINMAKAVEGDETTREAFAKLGLDAGQLMGVGPKEAMLQIADAMAGVTNHADRLKISMEIFGKSGADLASTLGEGRDALESSAGFAEKWLGLTDQQLAMVGANNDAWDRIGIVVEGLSQMLASEVAPIMELVADEILGVASNVEGASGFIRAWVDGMTQFYGDAYDVNELITAIAEKLYSVATLDFEGATKPLSDAAKTFDTADKMLEALNDKRMAASEAAHEAERKRQEQRTAMALQDTDKELKAKETALEKAAKEEQRLREAAEKEARKSAEDALKNAEKYFEDERKRQMKLREDVAKGPGAGMEAGSAEAARFMAEQANAAIAESTVGVDGKPTDEQLVEQAKIQVEIARSAKVKQDEMVSKMQVLTDAVKENGFKRIR